MKPRLLISKLLLAMVCFFALSALHAGTQPKFTIIPTTATTIEITPTGTATVQYVVTNQTKITRTLAMSSIQGITQLTTDTGACANPFTLGYKQSCLLTLQLTGSELPARVTRGPEICKTEGNGNTNPDPFLCSQPTFAASLNITRTDTAGEASIAITTGSPLALQVSGSAGTMTIQNNSTTEIASDIAPDFTGTALDGLVSVTGNTCDSVNPGDTCTLTFTPGSTEVAATDFPIAGTNTTSVTGSISIASFYAYVTNVNTAGVSLCPISTSGSFGTCQLTGTSGTVFNDSYGVTLNPAKTHAYLTYETNNAVSFCPINTDKTLGTCSDAYTTGTTFLVPTQLTFNGDGSLAYVGNGGYVLLCPVSSVNGTFGACASTGSGFVGNTSVVLNAAGTIAYVASYDSGNGFVSLCDVSSVDGTLSGCTTSTGVTTGLAGPWDMALNSAGTFLYIVNKDGTDFTVCTVSATDGSLSGCTSALAGLAGPAGIALNSAGTLAYVSSITNEIVIICSISSTDGTLSGCTVASESTFDDPAGIALLES